MKTKNTRKKRKFPWIFAAVLVFLAGITVWFEVPVTEYVALDGNGKIDKPVRAVLVTDLHSGYYGKNMSTLVKMIEKQNADVVLLGGDIFDDDLKEDNTKKFIERIAPEIPCFYVTGNHEFWSEREEEMKAFMEASGVTVLDGDCESVEINGNIIDICGVDDPTRLKNDEWIKQLDDADRLSDPAHYRILISHRPERTDVYEKYGFDLIVSGHAHGGQWRIPFTKRGYFAPNQGMFPKYISGPYTLKNGSVMVVSRGLARESTPAPRYFNHPEIVVIDIG